MMRTQNDRKSLNASDDSVLALSDAWPIPLRIHHVDASNAKVAMHSFPCNVMQSRRTCCFDLLCGSCSFVEYLTVTLDLSGILGKLSSDDENTE